MSYQQFLQSTSNLLPDHEPATPISHVQRKPVTSSGQSISSMSGSINNASPYTNTRSSPFSSVPSQSEPTKNSIDVSSSPAQIGKHALLNNSNHTRPSELKPLTQQEIDNALSTCLDIQQTAVAEHGKRPFAALLLAPDNSTVLSTHFSISHFQHAESELARLAAIQYSQPWLARCTLVSTWEPCAMCSGTLYWAGIGRLLYGASESRLKELTGADNNENMTMNLPCRTVLSSGQRDIEVIGPMSGWEQKIVDDSGEWWKEHQKPQTNGVIKPKENGVVHQPGVSVYDTQGTMLGSVDEEGEYQADLRIDWMS